MSVFPDNSDGRSKLEDEIKQLETTGTSAPSKPTLPVVTLKEMSYNAPSDAEINASAASSLAQYRTDGINSINADNANSGKELNEKRAVYASQLESALADLDKNYASAAESIDNDVLKRGLGRSSIAVGQKEELAAEYAAKKADVGSDYSMKIADIDAEINSLSAKLAKALDDFDIAYAAKLNEAVNKLKTERAQKIEEVEKYNNDVRYKQAQLNESKAKTESQLYSDALAQREKENSTDLVSAERREEIYRSAYDKMDAFLGSLSSEEAKLEIKNHTFYRQHLSDYYYYKLYDKYGR